MSASAGSVPAPEPVGMSMNPERTPSELRKCRKFPSSTRARAKAQERRNVPACAIPPPVRESPPGGTAGGKAAKCGRSVENVDALRTQARRLRHVIGRWPPPQRHKKSETSDLQHARARRAPGAPKRVGMSNPTPGARKSPRRDGRRQSGEVWRKCGEILIFAAKSSQRRRQGPKLARAPPPAEYILRLLCYF